VRARKCLSVPRNDYPRLSGVRYDRWIGSEWVRISRFTVVRCLSRKAVVRCAGVRVTCDHANSPEECFRLWSHLGVSVRECSSLAASEAAVIELTNSGVVVPFVYCVMGVHRQR